MIQTFMKSAAFVVIAGLAACGGGGGSTAASGGSNPGAGASATAGGTTAVTQSAVPGLSSGTITAFGSVFVNGFEYQTTGAAVIDDDHPEAAVTNTAGLAVGMVVDVKAAAGSSAAAPVASQIHVSPLARGTVDASDITGSTITVMGQVVSLDTATVFVDDRACARSGATTPCTAITGQSGLQATAGTTPGSFVAIHGYLFAGTASAPAQIVATLVRIIDDSVGLTEYKAEGQVTAVDTNGTTTPNITIGSLVIGLSSATCYAAGAGLTSAACSNLFQVGNIVSVVGLTAPASGVFTASRARGKNTLAQTPGATVQVEGKVSRSDSSAKTFALRGITIDASALNTLPADGDVVVVLGTVSSTGTSITATSVTVKRYALAATVILAQPLAPAPTAGTTAGTYTVVLLGQNVTVNASTQLADRTAPGATFNINNFQSYLGSTTPNLVVRAVDDGSGNLTALALDIVSTAVTGVAGVVAATPAPDATTPTAATLSVHGVTVVYDSTARHAGNVTAGTFVIAEGTLKGGTTSTVDTTVTGTGFFAAFGHQHNHDF